MADILLSADEKASLTDFARKLVERSGRAGAGPVPVVPPSTEALDDFSTEGLLRRVLALEERLDRTGRAWKATVDSILVTMERLEARSARVEGEMSSIRELAQTLDTRASADRDELLEAVGIIVTNAVSDIGKLLERLDTATRSSAAPPPSAARKF